MSNVQNQPQLVSHSQPIKLPKQFYQGLCELFLELGIDGDEFVDEFTQNYIECAAKKAKTKADIYNATGFSEYTVRKYLDSSQHKAYSKRKLYYRSLVNEIKDLCTKSNDGCIPIHGSDKSYVAAFNEAHATDNTNTAPSVLKKLIKVGIVKKVGKQKIKFITSLPTKGLNNKEYTIEYFSNLINRMSSTVLHNYIVENNEDTLFQMTYYSNVVHPDNFKKLANWLRTEQRKDYRKYQKKIDSCEETGSQRKWVESLNLEIGITSLIFKNSYEVNQ